MPPTEEIACQLPVTSIPDATILASPSVKRKTQQLIFIENSSNGPAEYINTLLPTGTELSAIKTPLVYFENYFPDTFFGKTAQCTATYSVSKYGR